MKVGSGSAKLLRSRVTHQEEQCLPVVADVPAAYCAASRIRALNKKKLTKVTGSSTKGSLENLPSGQSLSKDF